MPKVLDLIIAIFAEGSSMLYRSQITPADRFQFTLLPPLASLGVGNPWKADRPIVFWASDQACDPAAGASATYEQLLVSEQLWPGGINVNEAFVVG